MSDLIHIGTPESVDLAFEPVGMGSRFVAALIDAMIQWAVLFLLVLLLIPVGAIGSLAGEMVQNIIVAILGLVMTLLLSFYKLLFEAVWNGQTIGKRLVGIRVVRDNGLPVQFSQVLIRNLMRVVDIMPPMYTLGGIIVLFTKKHQRLGDVAAGTVVVRDRKVAVPTTPVLNRPPTSDLLVLREHVRRLEEADLAAARAFLQRRNDLAPQHRLNIGYQIVTMLVGRMGWQAPVYHPEAFLEEIFYVRAQD